MRKIVLVLGLPRSGSTWVYNAVRMLFEAAEGSCSAFFAECLSHFPQDAFRTCSSLVVKSHNISAYPANFLDDVFIVASIRDPRDATMSLMQMFGFSFDVAASKLAPSAEAIVQATETRPTFLLRYEGRFFETRETLERLAEYLGLSVEPNDVERVFHALSWRGVNETIQRMQSSGVLPGDDQPEAFDVTTQWHPNHLRDGRSGKYKSFFVDAELDVLTEKTDRFLGKFYAEGDGGRTCPSDRIGSPATAS